MLRRTYPAKGILLLALVGGIAGCKGAAPPVSTPPPAKLDGADFLRNVRRELRLETVQHEEERLRAQPADAEARLSLAKSYADTQDPCGAALALFPLTEKASGPGVLVPYVQHCLTLNWLDEAEAALKRLKPAPAALQIATAEARLEHGGGAAALEHLRGAERAGPKGEEWFNGAVLYLRARRPDAALSWVEHGLKTHPATPPVLNLKARCLLQSGDAPGALRVLSASETDAPGDPERLLLTGQAELQSKPAEVRSRGIERLAQLASTGKGNAAAGFEAGRALVEDGKGARAADLLQWALRSRYQEVLTFELLGRAYEQSGRRPEALLFQGKAHLGRWRLPDAQRCLRQAVELNPEDAIAPLDLARALSADGKLDEALQVLTAAETRFPKRLDLALLKASVFGRLERVKEQTACLQQASEWDPARANEPLGELGKLYHDSQQFDLARATLERAVALDAGDAFSHLYLGLTYSSQSQEDAASGKAVFHLLQAAKASPDYHFPWMNAGSVLQRMGHLPEAAACLRRAIGGDSRWEGPYASLAQLLHKQGLKDERRLLLRTYSRARTLEQRRTELENQVHQHPMDANARLALGDRQLRDGDTRTALETLVIATSLAPGSKAALLRLADACALLGFDTMRAEAERAAR